MERAFSQILTTWYKKFQRYKVGYKNGSYQLNHLFHSPETIVESFDKMPFCKHDRSKQLQTTDSMFLKANMYYCKLEEGLWVIVSNLLFKKNVLMRNLYDDALPLEYHFVNIHIKNTTMVNKSLVNGLVLKDKTWSMYKAGHALTEYHFKNSNEKNISIFFTTEWLERQKEAHQFVQESKLASFFDSLNTGLILDETDLVYEDIHSELMSMAEAGIANNQEAIRTKVIEVFHRFVLKLNNEIISENHFKINDKDRKTIQRVEQLINEHLLGNFPGIEVLAKKVGVSPTKLKHDFKSMHDTSIYHYFSKQQMQLARELLLQRNHTVKEIATIFGYENASKFSAVFKKNFYVNPSELCTENPPEELYEHPD